LQHGFEVLLCSYIQFCTVLPTKHAKTQGYPSQYLQAHRDSPIALLSPGDRWFREILDMETRSWGFIMFQRLEESLWPLVSLKNSMTSKSEAQIEISYIKGSKA